MIKSIIPGAFVFVSLLIFSSDAGAQVKQRVNFARGANGITLKGTIRGYAYRDYVVRASAGKMMRVRIEKASGRYPIFTIFRPDGDNLGTATQTDSADGELPVSGDYVIRVGMMRNDARRRGSFSNYTLSINIE